MDFSAFNPQSTNSLNIAARENDTTTLKRLLKKHNPNCVDNRGWTCLHEAAANDSYESMFLILQHSGCRPLNETYEGHTALYLACRNKCSIETIKGLLANVEDIANYASTERVTPLHVVSQQGRIEVLQLLLQFGAVINIQDFDGDTPLHDAAFSKQPDIVSFLLHAGAEPEEKNGAQYTPFHLACMKGSFESVEIMYPFITNINECTANGDTALILASQVGSQEIVDFLLKNGADPNISNNVGELPLNLALERGNSQIFRTLLSVTDVNVINYDIFILSCKPHFFNMDIIIALLESDLGPDFFNVCETFHVTFEKIGGIKKMYQLNSPLNPFLHISEYIYCQSPDLFCRLFLLLMMRGVAVDALYVEECPPLVYIHYCEHTECFDKVVEMLVQQGCNVDYSSDLSMPDAVFASMATGASTLPTLLQYSLACEPTDLVHFMTENDLLGRTSLNVQQRIVAIADLCRQAEVLHSITTLTPSLKHLCRLKVRHVIRCKGVDNTKQFFKVLELTPLPKILQRFLRYL